MCDKKYRSICYKCLRPVQSCFCDDIHPFETNFEFCILMHPKEAKIGHIGTGRMTNQALENCRIIVGENFDNDHQVQKLLDSDMYFPMVLYPGENSINISKESFPENYFQKKAPLIFIIDGTWACAKSMMRDSKSLHPLPRISFDHTIESAYTIRQQPAKYCLSTIESVYQVIKNLERIGLENPGDKKEVLIDSLKKLVDFQKKCANDPNMKNRYDRGKRAYKLPSERTPSKKWEYRKICFEDNNY